MQKHDQVDLVSLAPDGSTVFLSLIETRPWDENGENLFDFQSKLNSYLDFVESGQLETTYPEARGKKIVFRLHAAEHPTGEAIRFIEIVERQCLAPSEIGFEISVLS